MGRVKWRNAAIFALLVVVACNIVSSYQTTAGALTALRFAVGFLGQGTAFTLAIGSTGWTNGAQGGGFNLRYDADVITLTDVVIAGAWNFGSTASPGPAPSAPDANGFVSVNGIVFNACPALANGDHSIGTLSFLAAGPSGTPIEFSEYAANPFTGQGSRQALQRSKRSGLPRA